MSAWTARIAAGWVGLSTAAVTMAAESTAPPVPPHPLVVATEKVCRVGVPKDCLDMANIALSSPGLTVDDSISLLWVAVLQSFAAGDETSVRNKLTQIVHLDRSAQPPPSAPPQIGELLGKVRGRSPSGATRKDEPSRMEEARRAIREREPESKALLRAAGALYDNLDLEGTAVIIDMARSSELPTATERAQVFVWQGVLKMELKTEDKAGARAMFLEGLRADRGARLPNGASLKTFAVFEEAKAALSPQAPSAQGSTSSGFMSPGDGWNPLPTGRRAWGITVGGAGAALVAGGIVAGLIAQSAFDSEKSAAASGDFDAYVKNRDAAGTAVITSNVLYGAGVVALGAGIFLVVTAPGEVKVGTGAGPGKVTLTLSGSF